MAPPVRAGIALLLLLPFAVACSSPRTRPAAPSASAPPGATAVLPNEAGLARLSAAARAGRSLPYAGVQQVQVNAASGPRSSTVDVVHLPGSGMRLTVQPDGRAMTYVGQLPGPSLLPVVDERALARISSRYSVRGPLPGPTVAGRSTQVVELVRAAAPGVGSVAARFWLDTATALPLRRQVLDAAGRVQQTSEYSRICFSPGSGARPPAPLPSATASSVAAIVGSPLDLGQGVTPQQLDALRRQQWLAPAQLPEGFDLVDARVHGTQHERSAPPLVLQLTYTDGIAVLSLFEQRGQLDPAPLATWTRRPRGSGTVFVDTGTPQRAVWSARGSVYTVVGDDAAAVDDAMTGLPAPTAAPGVASRLRRGVERFGSWVNPFS